MFRSPYTYWLVAGFLFAAIYLHSYLLWLVLPACISYFHALNKSVNIKHVILGSLLMGTIKSASAISWLWSIYPLTWLTTEYQTAQLFLIGAYWLTSAITIAGGITLISILWWKIRAWSYSWYVLPFLWVVGEITGSILFSILVLGPSSTINANFSYGYIGYTLSPLPFINQLATIGGVYILSLVVFTVALLFYKKILLGEKHTGIYVLYCLLILISIAAGFTTQKTTGLNKAATTVVIETSFDASYTDYRERSRQITNALIMAAAEKPSYIILPEDTRFSTQFNSSVEVFAFLNTVFENDIILIDSSRVELHGQADILRAFIYDTKTATLHTTDKNYLVPHGEYLPYLHHAFLKKTIDQNTLRTLEKNLSYQPYEKKQAQFPENIPSVLFCMESTVPTKVSSQTQQRSIPFTSHLISHAWFNEPYNFWYQQNQMLRTQAIWSKTPIISAANMAPSHIYKANGEINRGEVTAESEFWKIIKIDMKKL